MDGWVVNNKNDWIRVTNEWFAPLWKTFFFGGGGV